MPRSIQSLQRAAAVLRLLAGGERRLGLSDIASTLGLPKGTAHGLLRTLQQEGFVEQDAGTGKYQLGAELLRLGTSYLDVHELRARALVWADDLARSSGESVYLGVLHQQGVLIVHHVFRPDDSRQVLEVGAMQPLHSTALGKVLAAWDPVAHSEAADGERRAFTERTITGLPEFEDVLDLTRARGWGADVEETWEGLASIAAPIVDGRRMPVGALGVTGAVERVCDVGDPAVEPAGVGAGPGVSPRAGGGPGPAAGAGAGGGHGTGGAVGEAALQLRPRLVAAVRDCARAVSRDLGAQLF